MSRILLYKRLHSGVCSKTLEPIGAGLRKRTCSVFACRCSVSPAGVIIAQKGERYVCAEQRQADPRRITSFLRALFRLVDDGFPKLTWRNVALAEAMMTNNSIFRQKDVREGEASDRAIAEAWLNRTFRPSGLVSLQRRVVEAVPRFLQRIAAIPRNHTHHSIGSKERSDRHVRCA